MARTQTLTIMVKNLRAETGHSTVPSQGLNNEETMQILLRRTQEELWAAFVWPELQLRDDVAMAAGIYLYDYSLNLKFDAIREAYAASPSSGHWTPVGYGISEDKIVPVTGVNTSLSDPVQFWEAEGDKFRVWPTPKSASYIRFKGNRELAPFVTTSDKCTLDATVIILFAAAEILARSKAEDAANKLQKAQRHLQKLLGNQVSAKNKISTYGAGSPSGGITHRTRGTIAAYP